MSKLIIAAIVAIVPLIIVIIKKMPSNDEKTKKDIDKYEDELEEVRTLMAKALADGLTAEYHLLNVRRERLQEKLRRLRRRL